MPSELSRRGLLVLGLGTTLVAACRSRGAQPIVSSAPNAPPGAPAPAPAAATASASASPPGAPPRLLCDATEDNIEGPYYRADAPYRRNLVDPSTLGPPLVLGGRVLSLDCRSPLAGAVLDVWQADAEGRYDNDGSIRTAPGAFRLRGKLECDATGAFEISTIVPGRYLNGSRYRPAHVHFKVTAPGHRVLTTQLYFPDDPFNEGDPFLRRSLIVEVSRGQRGTQARYDFVLPPV